MENSKKFITLIIERISPHGEVENSPRTDRETLQIAEAKAKSPNCKPISEYFGILSPGAYGDGVAYQRKLRDEWDD